MVHQCPVPVTAGGGPHSIGASACYFDTALAHGTATPLLLSALYARLAARCGLRVRLVALRDGFRLDRYTARV